MSADKKYLLAIDNGTQSVRALVFDLDGQLIAKSQVEIEPFFSDQPGWAEQHPHYLWDRLCDACQQLWPQLEFPRTDIEAVALTTQRATVINLDKEGQPLRPAIIWLDQREQQELPGMGAWGVVLTLAGAGANVHSFRTQAEANWIAARQPEIWQRTAKFLLLSGYHSYRLTGRYVDSVASQVGYLPFDFRRQQWCGQRDWKWKALPITRQQLPDLVPAGGILGRISDQAAKETGIPAGMALISAGADKACEVLGSGCLEPTTGSLSYGTTATYNTVDRRYLEVIRQVPAYPAAVPGLYNSETIVQRGYWMVNWFKREFGQPEQAAAARSGVKPEALFDDLLRQVPAGSMGLVLQPYWSPGLRIPGPEAKGAIIGFGDVHTRAHIYRAIIEGLAYALREGSERHERRSGHKIDRLKVSGGGSQSDQAMQITADIFGLAAERPHTFETSGLGAAINAAVATGLYPDYETAIDRMTHPGAVFTPIAANVQIYEQIYRQVYRKLYGKLGPLYKSIRAITGYPA